MQQCCAVLDVLARRHSAKSMQIPSFPSLLHYRLQPVPFVSRQPVLAAAVACCWICAQKSKRHAIYSFPSAAHFTNHTICASPSVVLAAAVACCGICAQKRAECKRHAIYFFPSASQLTTRTTCVSPSCACCSGGLLLDMCQEEGRAQKACSTGWEGACSAARHRAAACTGACRPGAS